MCAASKLTHELQHECAALRHEPSPISRERVAPAGHVHGHTLSRHQQSLSDENAGCSMATTAENVAELHGITREDCDEYALRSQLAAEAVRNGV